jgi:phenylacetate-coenzyme A ligase PaaK-like adenylate-forming protein
LKNLSEYSDFEKELFDFNISSFAEKALDSFYFQYRENGVYHQYVDLLGISVDSIKTVQDIPFLPIRFFKSHQVVAGQWGAERIFESSGTTGSVNSRHYVMRLDLYRQSFLNGFLHFYGDPKDWCILALLPSYLERQNSSLVYMAEELINLSQHPDSGFYLNQFDVLSDTLKRLEEQGQKTILLGVTFALLDFSEIYSMKLNHTIIMETGGMKGRKKEITREEVHTQLQKQFGVSSVHTEYGMTELLSQAYSTGNGLLVTPPWMKVILREEDDPLSIRDKAGADLGAGLINIIDLANRYSCSFVATDDLGVKHTDGRFEIIGRMDNSDIRGCSLMSRIPGI